MAVIVLQMGHVPRRSGATGTVREQEFAKALAPRIASRLSFRGHVVHVIGADSDVPSSDVFVALHTDGSTSRSRRGASVGYPDLNGARLAAAWKAAHQSVGYPGGFLPDNYTAALSGYYGFRKSRAKYRFLAEHGHTTHADDQAWLFANLDACADAHVRAIGVVLGHPTEYQPAPPMQRTEIGDTVEHRLITAQVNHEGAGYIDVPDKKVEQWVSTEKNGAYDGQGRPVNIPGEFHPMNWDGYLRIQMVGFPPNARLGVRYVVTG